MIEKEELDRFIASCKDEQAELLMTLGRIPAPSHHEEKRAAFCKKWFEHEGCNEVWIDEAQNVICKFNCDRYDEITVMMAHMDVVFNDTEELPMRRDGDILRAEGDNRVGRADLPAFRCERASRDVHERGFADAVVAEHGGPAGCERDGDVLENRFRRPGIRVGDM